MVFWNTLLVLSAALLVASQSSSSAGTPTQSGVVLPSSTAGLDPCMDTCFEEAAGANGCAIDDVNCACASAQLQADLTECLDAECSAFAAPQAQGLMAQLCNKVRIVATGTVTPGHLSLSPSSTGAIPTTQKSNSPATSSTGAVPKTPVRNQQSSSPATSSTGALPKTPVKNQQSSSPASMVLGAYLTSVVFATAVVGPLVWGWI
ncbi:hypothetical protein C8F04DRAFT_96325 [Mycena alexandri]|uniref:CFEM domain-containing protein n=1 Tax=Mycena alexandri TaxID=1745969 RepID=A0AAD6XA06_9AGAR|nr:hypothetical protein C8F04DRAFT_96325 [Mycena alexandri]